MWPQISSPLSGMLHLNHNQPFSVYCAKSSSEKAFSSSPASLWMLLLHGRCLTSTLLYFIIKCFGRVSTRTLRVRVSGGFPWSVRSQENDLTPRKLITDESNVVTPWPGSPGFRKPWIGQNLPQCSYSSFSSGAVLPNMAATRTCDYYVPIHQN